MKKRNKILLLAYTNKNFGDDMFIKTICTYFPKQNFILEAPAIYKKIFRNQKNLLVKDYDALIYKILEYLDIIINKTFHKRYVLRSLWVKKYLAVVYVTGSLFDEDKYWHQNIKKYGLENVKKRLWKDSCINKIPFFLLGCNMTHVITKKYKKQMDYCFRPLYDICFRDKYSYKLFQNLSNVRYAPDIVFNYNCSYRNKKNNIIISVWGALTKCNEFQQWKWAEHLWENYAKLLQDLIIYFQMKQKNITLLALCKNEGDVNGCNYILNNLNCKNYVKVYIYNGNLNYTIRLFEESEFIIGTRFHSIVMALNAGVPFYPIIYESKTEQLLNDFVYSGERTYIENIKKNDFENICHAYKRKEVIPCYWQKQDAKKQFEKLYNYLSTNGEEMKC